MVRSGADGGSVIAVGESSGRALQALVRIDPGGFAMRELADRVAARFPPAVTLITVEGPSDALTEFVSLLHPPPHAELLGPAEPDVQRSDGVAKTVIQRLMLRAPLSERPQLVQAVKETAAIRSARKSSGPLRIRVDPVDLG